jgi:predicted nuclease with RNAse H fold
MSRGSVDTVRGATAVGIDVAEERKGLDLVALDARRRLLASAGGLSVADVARLVLCELHPTIVCIDSPSGWSHSGKSRASERELRTLGITAFSTGPDPGDHPFYRWMRVGISVYAALSPSYPLFAGGTLSGTAVEVFPEATSVILAGRHRSGGETKRTFRRQVLRSSGVDEAALPTLDRVDAALAALTGMLALDGRFTTVGDPGEGVILLPAALPGGRSPNGGSPAPVPV